MVESPAFEPIKDSSAMRLTWKTFSLALASAKRIRELEALSCDVGFSPVDGCTLSSYVPEFITKTELATFAAPRTSRLLSLHTIVGEDEEKLLLCSVKTLRKYVERTRLLRGG